MGARRMAEIIVEAGAVKLGSYRLSSGGVTSVYIDLRELPMKPSLFKEAVYVFTSEASRVVSEAGVDAIAGVATGGIPWAIAAALKLGMPATYVRPRPKEHGTGRLVEADVEGLRILVVDDVSTTGASLSRAVENLERAGAQVSAALVVVDRLSGASERLRSMGVPLYSVTDVREVLRVMAERGVGDRGLLARALREVGLSG